MEVSSLVAISLQDKNSDNKTNKKKKKDKRKKMSWMHLALLRLFCSDGVV